MTRLQLSLKLIALTLVSWALTSCSDPEFGAVRGVNQDSTPNVRISSQNTCANFTLIRPQVDILFLWDNSTSSYFINPQTRQALNQLVNNVSNRFDYHIVLAPLVRANNWGVNDHMRIVTYDTAGLSAQAMSMRVAKENASNFLSFPPASSSFESGLERTREILHNNQTNGIFRQGAYTIIVAMSTEDDNSYQLGFNHPPAQFSSAHRQYVDNKMHELLCIRGNYSGVYGSSYTGGIYGANCSGAPALNSSMFRFLSIVANNTQQCSNNNINNAKVGASYQMASNKIYLEDYTNNNPAHTDQTGAPWQERPNGGYNLYDNTDICRADYRGIFDGVNSVIQDTVVKHTYNYWPVAQPAASVDPDTLIVRNSNGQEFYEIPSSVVIIEDTGGKDDRDLSNQPIHGWRYAGVQNRNTRFLPSHGESYEGHLVQLFGQAKVTYPDCMQITFSAEREYYGYVHITSKPLESSIELRINGSLIPRCASSSSNHCWVLEKQGSEPHYQTNKNIKISSPTDFTPATPPDTRTGFFLRLRGNAVYSNGANVNVVWLPSS